MINMISYIIALYIVICALVGTIGIGRHIGFFLSFIISLLATPIIGLIVTALSNKTIGEMVINSNTKITGSISDELLKLIDLREKGILTEDEFLKQKQRILN